MSSRDLLAEIERWYAGNCDGDWEHEFGITIETLDNPGWSVSIELEGTTAEFLDFVPIDVHRHENDWIQCSVSGKKFCGAGGLGSLGPILTVFLDWTQPAVPD